MRFSALSTVALLTVAAALIDPATADLGDRRPQHDALAHRRAYEASNHSDRMHYARKEAGRDSVRKHAAYRKTKKGKGKAKAQSKPKKAKSKAKASAKAKATAKANVTAPAIKGAKVEAVEAPVPPPPAADAAAVPQPPAPPAPAAVPAAAPASPAPGGPDLAGILRPAAAFMPMLNDLLPQAPKAPAAAASSSSSAPPAVGDNIVPVRPGSADMTTGPRSDRDVIYQSVPLGNLKVAANNKNPSPSSGRVVMAATAPGVQNVMGRGQDPAPLSRIVNGQEIFYFPDVDFAKGVLIRSSPDLNAVQRSAPKMVFTYGSRIGTEAADLAEWSDGKYILTVSSTRDDTIHSLVSKTDDPLGEWDDQGEIQGDDGEPIEGYDSHVFAHPNGKRYITWSDHHSIILGELSAANRVVGNQVPIAYFPTPAKQNWFDHREFYNTEAPSTVVLPNQNGSQTLNLVFANGNFERSDYHTRLMYIDTSLDPLVPNNWILADQSVLETKSDVGVYGPGSGGFFTRNGQTWFAYGAWAYADGQGPAWSGRQRTIRAQQVALNPNGIVRPMEPVAATLDN